MFKSKIKPTSYRYFNLKRNGIIMGIYRGLNPSAMYLDMIHRTLNVEVQETTFKDSQAFFSK
jgi:hypothetical protein